MPRKPKVTEWGKLVTRLERLYAKGEDKYGEDGISFLSNGERTLNYAASEWRKCFHWLQDAEATAENDRLDQIRADLHRLTLEYTDTPYKNLHEICNLTFCNPLEKRWPWETGEKHWSYVEIDYVGQLFIEELLSIAREAADVEPLIAGPDPASGAVSVRWVAKRTGEKVKAIEYQMKKFKREHGDWPEYAIPPGLGEGNPRMIDWFIYGRW